MYAFSIHNSNTDVQTYFLYRLAEFSSEMLKSSDYDSLTILTLSMVSKVMVSKVLKFLNRTCNVT